MFLVDSSEILSSEIIFLLCLIDVVCNFFLIRRNVVSHSKFSSVQFSRSVLSDSLRPHESQHARPPCPSPTPGVHSNSSPSSQ